MTENIWRLVLFKLTEFIEKIPVSITGKPGFQEDIIGYEKRCINQEEMV
jgi:hypothetical protein